MITSQPSGPSGGDWRADAACHGKDPERFFPTSSTGPRRIEEEARAKQVCRRCPVAEQCLAWALESGQDFGVWGGHSEAERREIKRGQKPTRQPSAPDPELAAVARSSATTAEKRTRARRAIEVQRQPRTAVAAAFGVSTRTVDRWLAQERDRTPCPA